MSRLDFQRFKDNIETLSDFGSRYYMLPGNAQAVAWVRNELEQWGYTVEEQLVLGVKNLWVTRVSSRNPQNMVIISAHIDSVLGSPGADDDASGCSLVLEAARVFADPNIVLNMSVRFALWNVEENGLQGSEAYVAARAGLQGIEIPAGSNQFPEPRWLGMIQHDMILYDHLPAGTDIDIEWGNASLATLLAAGAAAHSDTFPAEASSGMSSTDSVSFNGATAAVSVRENKRLAEIGQGSNPHYHQPTDDFETYGPQDFLLGFNTTQTTVGGVAEMAGVGTPSPACVQIPSPGVDALPLNWNGGTHSVYRTVSITNPDSAGPPRVYSLEVEGPSDWQLSAPSLVWAGPGTQGEVQLLVNPPWDTPAGDYSITVRAVAVEDEDARTELIAIHTIDPPPCGSNPTRTLTPETQSASAGTSLEYLFTVTSVVPDHCSAVSYDLLSSVPSAEWTASFAPPGPFTLPPGASEQFTFTLTSPATAAPGTYDFWAGVREVGVTNPTMIDSGEYIVQ